MHNWRELGKGIKADGRKLKIKNVQEHHDGIYTCIDYNTRAMATSQLRVGCESI